MWRKVGRKGTRKLPALCAALILAVSLQTTAGTKPEEYILLSTNVGKRLYSEGSVRIGVNGKRVTFDGHFGSWGQILPYGIWLVGSKGKMKLGETVYSDEGEHAEFYWSGNVDLSEFVDLAIYRLPQDKAAPGAGAIRILSLPVRRFRPSPVPQHLRWPRRMISKARSSDGKMVAVYDPTGFYLADGSGKHRRKLNISLGDRSGYVTTVTLSFNRSGNTLAALATGWFGEPHVNYDGLLWSVDAKTASVRKAKEWDDNLLGAGWREVDHQLSGWSTDGKSVKITANAYYLRDGIGDMEERGPRSFWVAMTAPPKKPVKK